MTAQAMWALISRRELSSGSRDGFPSGLAPLVRDETRPAVE